MTQPDQTNLLRPVFQTRPVFWLSRAKKTDSETDLSESVFLALLSQSQKNWFWKIYSDVVIFLLVQYLI